MRCSSELTAKPILTRTLARNSILFQDSHEQNKQLYPEVNHKISPSTHFRATMFKATYLKHFLQTTPNQLTTSPPLKVMGQVPAPVKTGDSHYLTQGPCAAPSPQQSTFLHLSHLLLLPLLLGLLPGESYRTF